MNLKCIMVYNILTYTLTTAINGITIKENGKQDNARSWGNYLFGYQTRGGKAPEGSSVRVGTGYHWFVLSHQFVHKLNANEYTTADWF